MNITEQSIYVNTVHAMMKNFHMFLIAIENSDAQITNKQVIDSIQKINVTMQKILSKLVINSDMTIESKNINVNLSNSVISKNFTNLELCTKKHTFENIVQNPDEVLNKVNEMIKNDVENEDSCKFNVDSTKEIIKDTVKTSNTVPCIPTLHNIIYCSDTCEIESKKVKKVNSCTDVDEHIVQVGIDMYNCNICHITNLSSNNIISHLCGKQHKNSIKKLNSHSSCDMLNNIVPNLDFIADLDPRLTKRVDGSEYIIMGHCYKCTLCDISCNSECNLKQHINGSKHKQRCDDNNKI